MIKDDNFYSLYRLSSVSAYYSLFFKVTVSSLTILTIFVENVLDLHIEMIFVIFLTIYFIRKQDFYILKACLAFLFVRFKRRLIQ